MILALLMWVTLRHVVDAGATREAAYAAFHDVLLPGLYVLAWGLVHHVVRVIHVAQAQRVSQLVSDYQVVAAGPDERLAPEVHRGDPAGGHIVAVVVVRIAVGEHRGDGSHLIAGALALQAPHRTGGLHVSEVRGVAGVQRNHAELGGRVVTCARES
jgi:hypothetical protein